MILKKFLYTIYTLNFIYRRIIFLFLDNIIFQLTLILSTITLSIKSNSLYLSIINYFNNYSFFSLLIALIGTLVFIYTGQYKSLTKYIGSKSIYYINLRVFFIILSAFIVSKFINIVTPDILPLLTCWLLTFLFISGLRIISRDILINLSLNNKQKTKLVIYGAGAAGAQLSASLLLSGNYDIIAFIDDNYKLWKRSINGIKIEPPTFLTEYRNLIDKVLLAIPSLLNNQKIKIIQKVKKESINILQIPSLEDLTTGRAKIDDLKEVDIDDLLRRDKVLIQKASYGKSIFGKNVCITGAGGSIGKELCNQISILNPSKIILIDNHEPSLYYVEKLLMEKGFETIFPILSDLKSVDEIGKIIVSYNINIIFHAAAYKHVPLVEINPISAISNNIFITKYLCEASFLNNVEKFILISSDKAVRPKNIMGVTKRISELITQAYDEKAKKSNIKNNLTFSMVRFGNVLNSSGSVIPLFKDQIKKGGPITVTHEKIVRYFMTIPEAVQLVIQAVEMSIGGEVFLLDMGEPVKIIDLAFDMVRLSGLTIKDSNNKEGDIEIKISGLRKGEKLYEELLINSDSEKTKHPLIFKANEEYIKYKKLTKKLNLLQTYLSDSNEEMVFNCLKDLVPEWEKG